MPTRIEIKAECAPSINLLIENCCDPLIQEVISFDTPYLPPIGAFVDSEGNCWTLIGTTTDPVNSIRKVGGDYGSCEMCLIDNPCPENLVVQSCCAVFETIFSGSLPGVGVGDTFSDNFGFCWAITEITAAPINGVVSVSTAYSIEDCTTCLIDNECPDIYFIRSCCKNICITQIPITLYTTLEQLGGGTPGETFVDQFGFCWTIGLLPEETFTLLTGSFIQYARSSVNCGVCVEENNDCETLINYTIQNCLTLETEVVQDTFGFPVNYSILVSFTTNLTPRCYKIISWDNTSLPTKIIDRIYDCFINCENCRS